MSPEPEEELDQDVIERDTARRFGLAHRLVLFENDSVPVDPHVAPLEPADRPVLQARRGTREIPCRVVPIPISRAGERSGSARALAFTLRGSSSVWPAAALAFAAPVPTRGLAGVSRPWAPAPPAWQLVVWAIAWRRLRGCGLRLLGVCGNDDLDSVLILPPTK